MAKIKRPTLKAIREAVTDEPNMDVFELMDELVDQPEDDDPTMAETEQRFEVLEWAVDRAREMRASK